MNTNFDDTSYNQDEIADIRLFDLSICNKKANTQCTFKVNTLEHGVLEDFESVELFYSEEDIAPYMNLNMYDHKGNISKTKKILGDKLITMCIPPTYDSNCCNKKKYVEEYIKMKNNIASKIIHGGSKLGYEYPTSVQKITIPSIILGKDVICQAYSGTGKTHAIIFGLLWHIDVNKKEPQILVITNTHEVAQQLYNHVADVIPNGYTHKLCIGGQQRTNIVEEYEQIKKSQVIVGTMGKVHELMTRLFKSKPIINPSSLIAVAIDEFDIIMSSSRSNRNILSSSKSTSEQLNEIIGYLEKDKTMRIFFSATVSDETKDQAYRYFRNYVPELGEPLLSFLEESNQTLSGIKQYYVNIGDSDYKSKKETFEDIYLSCTVCQAICFVNKKETAERLNNDLDTKISRKIYHGNLEKNERKETIESVRKSEVRLLISSDLGSRGLDLNGISVVFNFDVPPSIDTYIHRIGRSGRQERKGVAITLVTSSELNFVKEVSKKSKYPMEELPVNITGIFN